MIILGISSGFHDAAVTVVKNGKIVFAAHAERYSKQKNDPWLNQELINAALEHGKPTLQKKLAVSYQVTSTVSERCRRKIGSRSSIHN